MAAFRGGRRPHVPLELEKSKHWIVIIMALASFSDLPNDLPEDYLIGNLENILPMLASTLFKLIARILRE